MTDPTYAYAGTLSEVLKLPSSVAGTDDLGDYSFTYNTQHWLSGLADTSKTNQSYSYAFSSSKELNELDYPNTLELHQTWSSKMLDLLTVTDASQQTTYLSSDATYNANEQMSDYDFEVNAGQNTFSEAYDLSYDTKGRISTIETDSSNRTLTYGYDAYDGQLTSLAFSDLGTYGIDYLGNGNIDSITYPNNQGEESYTYDGGKGRLSEIAYPNDDTLEFQWNAKDQVTRLDYYDDSADSTTSYVLVYNDLGRLASSTHLIDSITQSVWSYAWGLHGLEKATKTVNSQTTLTQDFTTDPKGMILSMTYDTTGEGYDGELYFHYDHYGNTTLLTDEEGDPVFSAQYDPCRGKTQQTWNTSNLEIINQGQGRFGSITLGVASNIISLVSSSRSMIISNDYCSSSVYNSATDLFCYLEGYKKEGNPDANPCKEDCNELISSFARDFTMYIGWKNSKKVFNETGIIIIPILIVTPFGFNYELQKQEDDEKEDLTEFFKKLFGDDYNEAMNDMYDEKIQTELENCMDDCEKIRDSGCEIPDECFDYGFI